MIYNLGTNGGDLNAYIGLIKAINMWLTIFIHISVPVTLYVLYYIKKKDNLASSFRTIVLMEKESLKKTRTYSNGGKNSSQFFHH